MRSCLLPLEGHRWSRRRIYPAFYLPQSGLDAQGNLTVSPSIVDRHVRSIRSELGLLQIAHQFHANQLSVKVWLLPEWYLRLVARRAHLRRTAVDWSSDWLRRPTMVLAAESAGVGTRSTGRPWGIGKGLLGRCIFGGGADVAIVDNNLFGGNYQLSWWRYMFEPPEHTLGLSRRDVRALRSAYSTAIAASLRVNDSAPAFGCITVDCPTSSPISSTAIHACGSVLEVASRSLSDDLRAKTDYHIPRHYYLPVAGH